MRERVARAFGLGALVLLSLGAGRTSGRVVTPAQLPAALAAKLSAELPPSSATGLPFGPWHLPDSLLRGPFSGSVLALHPYDAMERLEAARRAHFRVFVILDRSRVRHQNPDKSFNLQLWEQEVERFAGMDFGSYVKDGTILGHLLIDEPHDPTNWNGKPVPYAVIDSAAAYSKRLWPTLPAGVAAPPSFLKDGSWRSLDFGFAQYKPKKGDVSPWLAREVQDARASRLALVVSLNVLDGGGRGVPLTGAELRTYGSALAAEPYACALTMWKYDIKDPSYFRRPDVLAAVDAVARVAAEHRATSCGRPS
jgi:hypothetical protein